MNCNKTTTLKTNKQIQNNNNFWLVHSKFKHYHRTAIF